LQVDFPKFIVWTIIKNGKPKALHLAFFAF